MLDDRQAASRGGIVVNLATAVIGPLLVPECARSSRRGWVFLIRAVGGLSFAVPVLISFWWWWISGNIAAGYRPSSLIPRTLMLLEGLAIGFCLLLGPAVLAGSLAGEKERGSIGLLLSTRVDAREIVLGRLFGKHSMVAAILLAGLPFSLGFAALADLPIGSTLILLALPLTVGFGAGGIATAASAIARRGRNALIAVYILELLLLLPGSLGRAILGTRGAAGTLRSWIAGLLTWLDPLDPFSGIVPLIGRGQPVPSFLSVLAWAAIGIAGVTVASWRLRPSYLALVGGKVQGNSRRGHTPSVDEERPMLWKELYIEKAAALGWFGRVFGGLLVSYLVLGSLIVAGLAFWRLARRDAAGFDFYSSLMGHLYDDPSSLVALLIPLSVGLKAAVTISSERERETWDALLTSPLTGREILRGKLVGSLFSLRWLILAALLSWGLTLAVGAMSPSDFISLVGMTAVVSMFLAAVGVRTSLSLATPTKAMSLTVGIGIAAFLGIGLLASLILLVIFLTCLVSWLMAQQFGLIAAGTRPWFPSHPEQILQGVMALMYLCFTAQIVLSSWSGFDRIAGRLAGDGSDRPPSPRYLPANPPSKPSLVAGDVAMVEKR